MPGSAVPAFHELPPGAGLAVALEQANDMAVLRHLDDSRLVDFIVAAERQIAHLQAAQLKALADMSTRENYVKPRLS